MHSYRLYVYDAEDRLIAPVMVISADNDEAATEQAKKMQDGFRAELPDGNRLVKRLPKSKRNFSAARGYTLGQNQNCFRPDCVR
jgi:hypothetical protein